MFIWRKVSSIVTWCQKWSWNWGCDVKVNLHMEAWKFIGHLPLAQECWAEICPCPSPFKHWFSHRNRMKFLSHYLPQHFSQYYQSLCLDPIGISDLQPCQRDYTFDHYWQSFIALPTASTYSIFTKYCQTYISKMSLYLLWRLSK